MTVSLASDLRAAAFDRSQPIPVQFLLLAMLPMIIAIDRSVPLPIRAMVALPALIVGGVLFVVVNAIMVNLGAGNQHLSTNEGGFEQLLLWIIVGAGLAIGLGMGGFIYFGVRRGGMDAAGDEEDEDAGGESGMLEV